MVLCVVCVAIIAIAATPSTAHAWTPGTHIFLGETILRSLALLPVSIAEIIAAFSGSGAGVGDFFLFT